MVKVKQTSLAKEKGVKMTALQKAIKELSMIDRFKMQNPQLFKKKGG